MNRLYRLRMYRWARHFVLCVCLSAALISQVYAKEMTERTVMIAAETWIRNIVGINRPDATITEMQPYSINGERKAYIAHLASGGFCLCGADDLVLPVYLYVPDGAFNSEDPDYRYFLQEIEERTNLLRAAVAENDPIIAAHQQDILAREALWRDLAAGKYPEQEARESLEEMAEPSLLVLDLTSRWSQGYPYNSQCPATSCYNDHAAVGCVATAMSQIMHYWKWPSVGYGSDAGSYNYRWTARCLVQPLSVNPGIPSYLQSRLSWSNGYLYLCGCWDQTVYEVAKQISTSSSYLSALATMWNQLSSATRTYAANMGTAYYAWNSMPDVCDGTNATEVAELCYHAGVALGMHYGLQGSTAYREDVDNALIDHFRYDQDATLTSRSIETMTQELQWMRPIELCGRNSDDEGHCWVVFGYDKSTDPNRLFLMHLGWGGDSAWYACDNIPDGLNLSQSHVMRIAPKDVVKFVGATDGGDGTPDNPYQNIEEAVSKAASGTTLIFKAASVNYFSATQLVINRPMVLKGKNITIRY